METDDIFDNEIFMNLMKAYIAQINSAVKISTVLCDHSENEELTGDDIICGLIYRLMVPMTQEEINESLNKADEILNDSEEEDDCQEYDTISEITEKSNISRKIKINNCNCDICSKVRDCLSNYHSFEPPDQLAQRFKNSIIETCDKHKIYI